MSVAGWIEYFQDHFGGAWTAPDRASVDQRGALLAQNMRYFEKSAATRYGFGRAFSLAGLPGNFATNSPYNWISSLGNYLVWMNPTVGIQAVLVSANPPTLLTVASGLTGFGATYAAVGPRLYISAWTMSSNDMQATQPAVAVTKSGGSFNADQIIPGPASQTLIPNTAPTEPNPGIVTAGKHNLGLRMQHRSGFLGRPGPDTSTSSNPTPTTFAPISFTSAGGKTLRWSFTPGVNWPADVVQVQVVMSPVFDPNRYFLVPGAVQAVTGGAATVVDITINIDDDSLVAGAAASECTNSLNFYTASATGNAFMNVAAIANIGTRMFYLSTLPDTNGNNYSVVFASDSGQYQQISLSQHFLQLPNQLQITSMFGVQGEIYLAGPHWTFKTRDTGGVPVTWPTPTIVDGRKGVLYPNCIDVNPSGLYAWIADKTGLYYFNGAYADIPISYEQKDVWDQIAFNQSYTRVVDDAIHYKVRVLGLLQNLSDTRVLSYDYTNGLDKKTVKFSLDNPPGNGGMLIVQNDLFGIPGNAVKSPELWFSPSGTQLGTAYFAREKDPARDATVYRDDWGLNPVAIHAIYEPNIFPANGYSVGDSWVLAHQAALIRIVGSQPITPQVFSFDKLNSINLPTVNLDSPAEGKQFLGGFLNSQSGFIYHFEQNVLDGHFTLTDINMYYTRSASHV